MDPLQVAFLQTGGAQCGVCTPGMLMAARAYLDAGGGPDEDAIRDAIAGNLCRCTGYTAIYRSIRTASSAVARSSATKTRRHRKAGHNANLKPPSTPRTPRKSPPG